MIAKAEIEAACARLEHVAVKTPLVRANLLGTNGQQFFLKLENLQHTGSFKLRGAYNKIASLTPAERACGVIASSAGNHAQGVAFSAAAFNTKAVICMPQTAPLAKIRNTKQLGAEVILHGQVYDEAYTKARQLQEEHGYTFIHPFDDPMVIAGQGSIACEILTQLDAVDTIIAPIGGGGLLSGIALAAKLYKPSIKIIGIEAEGAASMQASLAQNQLVTLPELKTLADGIAVKTVGPSTLAILQRYMDELITVTEDEIVRAIFYLMDRHQVIAEGAGAAAFAACLAGKIGPTAQKIAVVVSGGNIDLTLINKIIDYNLLKSNSRMAFTVTLTDRIGEVAELITLLAKNHANIHTLNNTNNGIFRTIDDFKKQEFTVVAEVLGAGHAAEILAILKQAGYIVKTIS